MLGMSKMINTSIRLSVSRTIANGFHFVVKLGGGSSLTYRLKSYKGKHTCRRNFKGIFGFL